METALLSKEACQSATLDGTSITFVYTKFKSFAVDGKSTANDVLKMLTVALENIADPVTAPYTLQVGGTRSRRLFRRRGLALATDNM